MSLTNVHIIATHQSYVLLRDLEIKRFEDEGLLAGTDLRSFGPREDVLGNSAFIGYGIDFRQNSLADIQAWYTQAGLSAFLTPADLVLLQSYQTNPSSTNLQALLNSFTHLPDEPAAARLSAAAVDARETQFDTRLGFVMLESNERAALMSMFYNGGAGIIGPSLLNALQNDNRAEAWYQIRYQSNGGKSASQGIASRRYRESDVFGLYGNQPLTESEARNVVKVVAKHQFGIAAYEGVYSPVKGNSVSISQSLLPATSFLISQFGAGLSLQRLFVAINIGGDPIQGAESNDLLLGDTGHDILIGGGGNDLLRGDLGKDLYVINNGDGNDTIVDTTSDLNGDGLPDGDGLGVVVLDHHLVQGGIRRSGETVYTTPTTTDQVITYQWDGTPGSDLTITGAGSTVTLKDFTNGQFGIQLTTVPASLVENPDLPEVGRSEYLRIDHYEQVGNDPITGEPQFAPVYAPFFDNNDNDTAMLAPPMGDENDLVHAGGGNDRVFSSGGDDQLFGDDGNDTLLGGEGNDFLHGGTGDDVLQGDARNNHLYGDEGNDVLRGGAGVDWLKGGSGGDLLLGRGGADYLEGEEGNDELEGHGGGDFLLGGAGDDLLFGDGAINSDFVPDEAGNDVLDRGDGNDAIAGEGGADQMWGGGGDDNLWGDYGLVVNIFGGNTLALLARGGNDTIDGGTGNDFLTGGVGDDMLEGGEGNDAIWGDFSVSDNWLPSEALTTFGGDDVLDGGAGDDYLAGGVGNDVIFGGDGTDRLYGEDFSGISIPGNDFLDGGADDDVLVGGLGNDMLAGGSGNDLLHGEGEQDVVTVGDDELAGEDGDDELYGGGGRDVLSGGRGDDALLGDDAVTFAVDGSRQALISSSPGNDTLYGGEGNDKLFGGGGNDVLSGGEGDDFLLGDDLVAKFTAPGPTTDPSFNPNFDAFSSTNLALSLNPGNDHLDGGNGRDFLFGQAGDDVLVSGAGNDSLYGGSGHDSLDGGDDDDMLEGGAGFDTYLYNAGDGADRIEDDALKLALTR